MSYVTTQSGHILQIVAGAVGAQKLGGAALFGPDLSAWPAWVVDAFSVIAMAKDEREEAMSK